MNNFDPSSLFRGKTIKKINKDTNKTTNKINDKIDVKDIKEEVNKTTEKTIEEIKEIKEEVNKTTEKTDVKENVNEKKEIKFLKNENFNNYDEIVDKNEQKNNNMNNYLIEQLRKEIEKMKIEINNITKTVSKLVEMQPNFMVNENSTLEIINEMQEYFKDE